jgi:hypothetical protein
MKPELREGAERLIRYESEHCVLYRDDEDNFCAGAEWALDNLHKLLKPREVPVINGKKVAIIEVEDESKT